MNRESSSTGPVPDQLLSTLERQAIEAIFDLRCDDALNEALEQQPAVAADHLSPWLLCYQAMERRLSRGDHGATLRLAQAACTRFEALGDADGRARAVAEAALARYHLGQYTAALADIAACPAAEWPSCTAALAL